MKKLMTADEWEAIKKRDYYVVKANEIIQKSKYTMTLQQQKLISYLISNITPDDDAKHLYSVSVAEYCRVLQIDPNSGKNYSDIKKSIKSIADKSLWLYLPDRKAVLIRWLNRVIVDGGSGTILFSFHEDMLPYLINLQKQYTQYKLQFVLSLRSKYSIRLYELLKSYEYLGILAIEIDDLKQRMDAENYQTYADFKRNVIERAINDINYCSDITVEYTAKKRGREYKVLTFTITQPSARDMAARQHALRLDKGAGK